MSSPENRVEKLLYGEGMCLECRTVKPLVMIRIEQGMAIGYTQTDPLGTRVVAAPRVGYCEPCAMQMLAAGKFGPKKKK